MSTADDDEDSQEFAHRAKKQCLHTRFDGQHAELGIDDLSTPGAALGLPPMAAAHTAAMKATQGGSNFVPSSAASVSGLSSTSGGTSAINVENMDGEEADLM